MSLGGLLKRSVQRIRTDGLRGFAQVVARRYWHPLSRNVLFGRVDRELILGHEFTLAVPAFSGGELASIFADLEGLARDIDASNGIEVRIAVLDRPGDLPTPPPLPFPVHVVRLQTPRLVLGYVLWSGNVYLPSYLDATHATALKDTLLRLGVEPLPTIDDARKKYASRLQIKLRGPGRNTHFLHRSLCERLGGAHYGYREPVDIGIVAELPAKFDYLMRECEINFVPTRDLNRYPGRVSRQYAVGQLYQKPYLVGQSVLDVGCDIRGVSEFVGANTHYVGADMQGLADVDIDLDARALPFAPREFETVLCFEVLEHLHKIHQAFDMMLSIADRYFVGSLFIESGVYRGRSTSPFGEPLGNMHLPIAPVFDRHEWVFSVTDALDFIYYRSKRSGFRIVRLDVFYDDTRLVPFQLARLRRAMRTGNIRFLAGSVELFGFVLERSSPERGVGDARSRTA